MQAVILAGGLATRMRPLTETVPKVLLEVAGRPFLDWQLERLRAAGYTRVLLCIAHLAEQVREHAGDGARFGLRLDYALDGPRLLGTGGALLQALPQLDDEFLLTYGDSYLPFDYAWPLHTLRAHADADAVMSVYRNQDALDRSNVRTDGEWVLAYEKGTGDPRFDHIDYGALAFRKSALIPFQGQLPLDLATVQTQLAEGGRLRAVLASERFYEVGSPQGLAALDSHLRGVRGAATVAPLP